MSVHNKFQPIRSSLLAGYMKHIYECLVLLYRKVSILLFESGSVDPHIFWIRIWFKESNIADPNYLFTGFWRSMKNEAICSTGKQKPWLIQKLF